MAELLLTRVRLERSAAELRNAKEAALELRQRESAMLDDPLLRQVGQLGELLTGLESRLRDEGHQVSLLVSQLDGATRDLRMVPLSSLLDRYPVAVRGLARRLGKQVQLRTEGEATEVDREVLERLDEPLLHLVQNAVDHGIESTERRQRQGKPAEATIFLRSWLAGQTLHLEVKDDGAGIDARAVRDRAVALKLVDAAGRPADVRGGGGAHHLLGRVLHPHRGLGGVGPGHRPQRGAVGGGGPGRQGGHHHPHQRPRAGHDLPPAGAGHRGHHRRGAVPHRRLPLRHPRLGGGDHRRVPEPTRWWTASTAGRSATATG